MKALAETNLAGEALIAWKRLLQEAHQGACWTASYAKPAKREKHGHEGTRTICGQARYVGEPVQIQRSLLVLAHKWSNLSG